MLNVAIVHLMHTQNVLALVLFQKNVKFKLEFVHTWAEGILTL